MRRAVLGMTAMLGVLGSAMADPPQFVPPGGFVKESETALAIARAVLIPIYGAKTIGDEEPFVATDLGDRWFVTGTLHCPGAPASSICLGGTAEVEIAKSDGRIVRLIHGR